MLSERSLHNAEHEDVSNGYRDRRVCHGGKVFELRVPRSRNSNFYPILLGVLKNQEEEAQKLVSSLLELLTSPAQREAVQKVKTSL